MRTHFGGYGTGTRNCHKINVAESISNKTNNDYEEQDGHAVDIFQTEMDFLSDISVYNSTLLMSATYSVRKKFLVKILRKAKTKLSASDFITYVNARNHYGYSALFLVLEAFYRVTGDNPSKTCLCTMARILLDDYADCLQDSVFAGDVATQTSMLQIAARQRCSNLVKLLLEYGADANAKDSLGWTSLHFAVLMNDIDTTRVLIEEGGACVFIANEDDMIPFQLLGVEISLNPLKQYLKTLMQHRSTGLDVDIPIVFDKTQEEEGTTSKLDEDGK